MSIKSFFSQNKPAPTEEAERPIQYIHEVSVPYIAAWLANVDIPDDQLQAFWAWIQPQGQTLNPLEMRYMVRDFKKIIEEQAA